MNELISDLGTYLFGLGCVAMFCYCLLNANKEDER